MAVGQVEDVVPWKPEGLPLGSSVPRYLREGAEGGPTSFKLVTRQDWGAMDPREEDETLPEDGDKKDKPKQLKEMKTPVEHVCFTWTGTPPCHTDEECLAQVQSIQRRHMEEVGLADITFSFLVGGNGAVYECRGWVHIPFRPLLYEYLEGKGIEIGYIGRYEYDPPPPLMLHTAFNFVMYGMKKNLIKPGIRGIHLA